MSDGILKELEASQVWNRRTRKKKVTIIESRSNAIAADIFSEAYVQLVRIEGKAELKWGNKKLQDDDIRRLSEARFAEVSSVILPQISK